MIEYDKANVTSSYPMLTEFEVATILDRAYLALIWQKVSGNNTRRVPFEYDQKAISDIQPLIRTVKHNLTVPTTRIASNVVTTNLPADCLSFIDLVLEQNKSDYPLDELHQRNVPTTLIPHNTVENFLVTPYNMPWIKKPVCFLENNNVNIAYDTISLGTLGSNDKALITYIKQPISFVKSLTNYVEDSDSGTYADFATREWVMENFVRKWKDVYSPESGIIEEIPSQQPTTPDAPSTPDTPTIPDNPVQKRSATWSVTSSKSITLTSVGATSQIQVSNPDNISISYTASSSGCVTVSNSGLITAVKAGQSPIQVYSVETDSYYSKTENIVVKVEINSSTSDTPSEQDPTQTENPGNAVDLGLPSGTLWADCNIGASSPQDVGDYLQWGDTIERDTCDIATYIYTDENDTNGYTYLGTSSDHTENYSIAGTQYDAAHVRWGNDWQMPSRAQMNELRDNCTWTWATRNNVQGYEVSGNGNSIFLPAAGYKVESSIISLSEYGFYWTDTLDTSVNEYFNLNIRVLRIKDDENIISYQPRYHGIPIRPVKSGAAQSRPGSNPSLDPEPDLETEYVDMGLPSGTKWAKMNLNYISEMQPPSDTIGNTLCTTGYFGFGDPTGEVTSQNNSDYGSSIQGVDTTPTDIAGTEYDICTATLGEGWSIPTREQFLELSNNCTWEFINMPETPGVTPTAQENDSQGNSYPSWKATSTINGNVLYFPAAGSYLPSTNTYNQQGSYCFYWTSYSKGSFSAVYAQIIGGITESWLFGDYTNPNDPQNPDTADYRTHMPIRPVYVESN